MGTRLWWGLAESAFGGSLELDDGFCASFPSTLTGHTLNSFGVGLSWFCGNGDGPSASTVAEHFL
jgi:hypothetical protein